jgi:hypothetical protein
MLTDDAARDLALFAGLEWSADDAAVLAPLVDAVAVWADDDVMARIAVPIVEELWPSDLRGDIESAVAASAPHALDDARADLSAGPRKSRLARAFVEQAAVELAGELMLPMHCLLCVEDGLAAAPEAERPRRALCVASVAGRAASIPEGELHRAFAAGAVSPFPSPAFALATDERRLAVRDWLRNLAELGRDSVPTLSEALRGLVAGPLPRVADDAIWHEAVAGLAEQFRAPLN